MSQNDKDTLREEYDFSGGVRGKHHEAYREGTNVVLLERDVAEDSDHKREGGLASGAKRL